MKRIQSILQKTRKPFQKGNRFEKYATLYEAFETIFFGTAQKTHSGAHIRGPIDLKKVMLTVIFAMFGVMFFGIYNAGYQYFHQLDDVTVSFFEIFWYGTLKVIPLFIVAYGVGLGIEFLFAFWRQHPVSEGFLVSGFLIIMIMPIDIPLWILALSTAFGVIIGKELFGGTGMNLLNLALLARAFAFFAYPGYMSGDKVWVSQASTVDAVSGETILGTLAAGNTPKYSMFDMFFGFIPGSIGETSTFFIMLGALVLIFTGVASARIIITGFLGAAITAFLFNLWGLNALMQFPWYQHLMVGGLAFGIVFMATDPVSAAQTPKGKYIYGFLIGVMSILIRIFNPAYPEGVMMAILLLNVFAPTIDHFVVAGNIRKRKQRAKHAKTS